VEHGSSPAERVRNDCVIWLCDTEEVIRLDGLLKMAASQK
jgi:hypothetical protein